MSLIERLTVCGASHELIVQIIGSLTNEQCLRMTDFLDTAIKNHEKLSEAQILESFTYCRKNLETRWESRGHWKQNCL